MNKKRKLNWINLSLWMFVYMMFVFGGFILGMIYQQILFTQEIGKVLSYTNLQINIDFNATKFTEELNNTFIPAWKQAFNETIQNQILTNGTDRN